MFLVKSRQRRFSRSDDGRDIRVGEFLSGFLRQRYGAYDDFFIEQSHVRYGGHSLQRPRDFEKHRRSANQFYLAISDSDEYMSYSDGSQETLSL
jgi:hypothetical protein